MIWTAEQYDTTNLVLKEGICPSKSGAISGDGLGNWIILDSSGSLISGEKLRLHCLIP